MSTCGAPTKSGAACGLVAGWGTAHKGSGHCRYHERAAEGQHTPGSVMQAPQYTIEDGVDYTLPSILSSSVSSMPGVHVAEYFEVTQPQHTQKSTYRNQFDYPNRSRFDAAVWMPTDDPLVEWDHSTRIVVWTNCHAAYHRNPLAKQAVQLTRQFAVGKGHTVTARNKAVQDVIDRFRANQDNAIHDYDRSFVEDLQVDGELMIRKFSGGVDGSVIVPLPPWHITDIVTEPGFFRRVKSYHMQYSEKGEWYEEDIAPDDMLFVAVNRHSYELRGRPDLFVILPWLRAYKEWLENRARQNQWRGALVWDVAIDGNPAAVSAAKANYSTPPTPGSVVVHHANEEWQALTNSVNAGDAAEDGRQIKLMTAVGVGLPEYMLSDGQNANLASATAQELPALWRFVDVQEIMREQVWTPIYQWVVQQAIDAGELSETVNVEDPDGDTVETLNGDTETVRALDAFTVDYPELQEDDPKTLAEALQIAALNNWISDEGASTAIAGKFGLDPNIERKRKKREKEQEAEEATQGTRPDPDDVGEMMRGMNGNGSQSQRS